MAFLDKVKTNALNFENYKPLKKNDGILKLMEGFYLQIGLLNGLK